MSRFHIESERNDTTTIEGSMMGAPLQRWQIKALEKGIGKISLDGNSVRNKPRSDFYTRSKIAGTTSGAEGPKTGPISGPFKTPAMLMSDTPLRSPQVERLAGGNKNAVRKGSVTAIGRKTPSKPNVEKGLSRPPTVRVTRTTPGKHTPQADRFIPNRAAMDMDMGHYRLMSLPSMPSDGTTDNDSEGARCRGGPEFERKMSEALGQPNQSNKILAFREKAPSNREGSTSKVLYSTTGTGTKSRSSRCIPQHSERILDAPGLMDDYYLNLLSWSSANMVALSLSGTVYLWNASTGSITELCEIDSSAEDEYVSCVEWAHDGNVLAVSNSLGAVQIWDVNQEKLVRTMPGHSSRVGSLSWNAHSLVSGSRSGAIHHHDVRVANHHVSSYLAHTQEVCGLEWSPDGRHIASGGNDNVLCVWDSAQGGARNNSGPLHSFPDHLAAVKAIAWCPWQSGLLASGGGTADRHIRFWNVTSGACLSRYDTNSQVCSIKWSANYHELVSGHGFSQHQLTIWKYPSMEKTTELFGHTSRILGLAMSPDGSTVASAAADETLRFWKCFEMDKKAKVAPKGKEGAPSVLNLHLRL